MSAYSDGDCCSVWQDRWLMARKEHVCDACHETIRAGVRYHLTFFVFDGGADQTKRCARCEAIFAHLSERIRKEGDLEEHCNDRLACGHAYKERWGEEPPPEIAALAFWLPKDGSP